MDAERADAVAAGPLSTSRVCGNSSSEAGHCGYYGQQSRCRVRALLVPRVADTGDDVEIPQGAAGIPTTT